jgi:hypothetical protein
MDYLVVYVRLYAWDSHAHPKLGSAPGLHIKRSSTSNRWTASWRNTRSKVIQRGRSSKCKSFSGLRASSYVLHVHTKCCIIQKLSLHEISWARILASYMEAVGRSQFPILCDRNCAHPCIWNMTFPLNGTSENSTFCPVLLFGCCAESHQPWKICLDVHSLWSVQVHWFSNLPPPHLAKKLAIFKPGYEWCPVNAILV